jgi:hypothetical protein
MHAQQRYVQAMRSYAHCDIYSCVPGRSTKLPPWTKACAEYVRVLNAPQQSVRRRTPLQALFDAAGMDVFQPLVIPRPVARTRSTRPPKKSLTALIARPARLFPGSRRLSGCSSVQIVLATGYSKCWCASYCIRHRRTAVPHPNTLPVSCRPGQVAPRRRSCC